MACDCAAWERQKEAVFALRAPEMRPRIARRAWELRRAGERARARGLVADAQRLYPNWWRP